MKLVLKELLTVFHPSETLETQTVRFGIELLARTYAIRSIPEIETERYNVNISNR